MATFKRKLPTEQETRLVFAACAFLVYSWTIIVYLWEVPGWQKYLSAGDIAAILAYALASALIESVLLFSAFILLRVLLPIQVFKDRFAGKAAALLFMNALWAILLHLMILSDQILTWTPRRYVVSAIVYLLSIVFSWAFVHISDFFARHIEELVNRMTVLLYVYVPFGVFGMVVVVVRNIL